ncbi:HAD-IA family hydrolase [bacterium]|nr:HAD-IA family hydrolase [bacterium]
MSVLGQLQGVIFDMDGTLVDSGLDFTAMRSEMGLTAGLPILEQLSRLTDDDRRTKEEILHRHEFAGADRARLIEGAQPLLEAIRQQGRLMAILTRNSRPTTQHTLAKLGIEHFFDVVLCREDGPHKPDPWAIQEICRRWQLPVSQVVMVGDFYLDLLTAQNAGCASILYTGGQDHQGMQGAELATHIARHLDELVPLLARQEDSI